LKATEGARMVSDRGGRYGYVVRSRQNVYRALRRKGASKSKAARISNAGRTFPQRSLMGRKAAKTRQARGRRR
jgi:hypothetical protein